MPLFYIEIPEDTIQKILIINNDINFNEYHNEICSHVPPFVISFWIICENVVLKKSNVLLLNKKIKDGGKLQIKVSKIIYIKGGIDVADEHECCICMNGENNYKLPCGHSFHKSCLFKWIRTNKSCPICRTTCKVKTKICT